MIASKQYGYLPPGHQFLALWCDCGGICRRNKIVVLVWLMVRVRLVLDSTVGVSAIYLYGLDY